MIVLMKRKRQGSKQKDWLGVRDDFRSLQITGGDAFIAVLALLECYSASRDTTGREGAPEVSLAATASDTRCSGTPP